MARLLNIKQYDLKVYFTYLFLLCYGLVYKCWVILFRINDSDPEPVLLLDPEESYDFDESGVSEIILDSSQVWYKYS